MGQSQTQDTIQWMLKDSNLSHSVQMSACSLEGLRGIWQTEEARLCWCWSRRRG